MYSKFKVKMLGWNCQSNKSVKIVIISLFLIAKSLFADNSVPPLLSKPEDIQESQKPVEAEVTAVKIMGEQGKNVPEEESNNGNASLLEGNEAVSFILKRLGVNGFDVIYKDKQTIQDGNLSELQFPINEGIKFFIQPQGGKETGVFDLNTRVQMEVEGNWLNIIEAIAKAKIGDPLVYKGISREGNDYIIILTLVRDSEKNQQGGNDNQQEGQDDKDQQEQKKETQMEENKENKEEKKEDEKKEDANEKKQIELLLESLEEIDQKEQKEMLNDRERIMLPDKWW